MRDTTVAADSFPVASVCEAAVPVMGRDQAQLDQAVRELEIELELRRLFAQIDAARIEQGMTKAELARRARLSTSYVSRLLNHGGNPRLTTMLALARGVGGRLVLEPAER